MLLWQQKPQSIFPNFEEVKANLYNVTNQNMYTCMGIGSEINTIEGLQMVLHFNFNVNFMLKKPSGMYYLKMGKLHNLHTDFS